MRLTATVNELISCGVGVVVSLQVPSQEPLHVPHPAVFAPAGCPCLCAAASLANQPAKDQVRTSPQPTRTVAELIHEVPASNRSPNTPNPPRKRLPAPYHPVKAAAIDFLTAPKAFEATSVPAAPRSGPPSGDPRQMLAIADVVNLVGLSRTTIYTLIRKGSFPSPCKLSASRNSCARWPRYAVEAFLDELVGADGQGEP